MERQELISVIIPVYNVEKYLHECIDSVLNQTYKNFEIILVDDGSTDSSGEICDEYKEKDDRVRVIHQKNQGLSRARNVGEGDAGGKYVYFLDSDDWILEETLAALVEKAEQEKAEVVFFEANSFSDCPKEFQVDQRYLRKHQYETEEGYLLLEKLQHNKEYHSAVPLLFFKKNFLVENKVKFFPGIIYEDMLYTFEVFCKAKRVAHVKKAFYQRRYRSNSIMTSHKSKKNFFSAKTVYEKVRDISEQTGKMGDKATTAYIIRCAFNALNLYKNLKWEEHGVCKKEYQRLKKDILNHQAYRSRALRARCYGVIPWFCYKVCEKLFMKRRKEEVRSE